MQRVEEAKEVFRQRREKPCFNLADVYQSDGGAGVEEKCFEELRLSGMQSKKQQIARELNDILSMFSTSTSISSLPKDQGILHKDADDESEEEGEDEKPEFEEKTCTIVTHQLPVQKLKFTKLDVYQSPSAAATNKKSLSRPSFDLKKANRSMNKPSTGPSDQQDNYDDDVVTPVKSYKSHVPVVAGSIAVVAEKENSNKEEAFDYSDPHLHDADLTGSFSISGGKFIKWFSVAAARYLLQPVVDCKLEQSFKLSPSTIPESVQRGQRLQLNNGQYEIRDLLGEGSYGKVYSALDLSDRKVETTDQKYCAVKLGDVESGKWEFQIMQKLHAHQSLKTETTSSQLMIPSVLDFAFDERRSVLVMERLRFSLLDLINCLPAVDELLVMFYCHEMLKACRHSIWNTSIVHCDLKPEHFMLRFPSSPWPPTTINNGNSFVGWEGCGLTVIDFGQALNVKQLHSLNVSRLISPTDSVNQRMGRKSSKNVVDMLNDFTRFPWDCQVDFIGICAIVYMMIFKQELQLPLADNTDVFNYDRWMEKVKSFKYRRGWNTGLWTKIFTDLLSSLTPSNTATCENNLYKMERIKAIADELLSILERELHINHDRNGKSLLYLLKRAHISLMDCRN